MFEFPDFTLAIVCDGMGGHVGGAQASTLAVRTIHDTMRELSGMSVADALVEAIQRTNLVIYEAARKNHRLMGMGTTVVASVVSGNTCWLAHVGDSRAYLVRQGAVHALTRDHTMVNLFVDAELLSPEDAATHPEAHVLSRSLGVERQVDVEISEPLELAPGDVVFLCSDGVHGIVTDWEIANVDWRAPHQAVHQVLDIVNTREGDDNATAVAVMLGTTFEDVPTTTPPEPKRIEDGGAIAGPGMTAVPVEDDLDPDFVSGGSPAGSPGYVVYDDHAGQPPQEEVVGASSSPPQPPVPVKPAPPAPAAKAEEPAAPPVPAKAAVAKPPAKRKSSNLIPILLASGALMAAAGVVLILLLPGSSGPSTDDAGSVEPLTPTPPTQPRPTQPTQPNPVAPVPPTPTAAAGTEQCPADAMVFSPKLPPPPRRLPYRATECTQPPPGGPEQFQAVEAARRHDCRSSLMSVQAGMKKSVDHCRLYQTAWLCFDEYHQRSLEGTKSKTWDDARFEVYHFEGTEDVQNAVWTEDDKRLPYWFRPPVDGLEFRLKMWNDDPQMAHYVNDLFGEPKVADDFAKDLQLEATLAAGLACVPEDQRTPQMIDAWARRVYFVADALQQDRTGRLLNQHRTDLIPVLKDLLAKATTDMTLADGTTVPIPEPVRDAYDTAMGTKPPPTSKPVVVPRPVDPTSLEPTIQDDGPGVTVNRRGR